MSQKLILRKLGLRDVFEINSRPFHDNRGIFVKTFSEQAFLSQGLRTDFREGYYTLSHKNTVRGMHFQMPPHEHTKLVYCSFGSALDVVVDLRVGSPDHGRFAVVDLSQEKANMVYIPAGCAHGFLALQEPTILVYQVTTEYSPEADAGIRWDSFGFSWPVVSPVVSNRDKSFPTMDTFRSPFNYGTGQAVQGE